nr:MAG TPA: hypothetical protein [Caudoviricetes sp.]
MVCFDRFCAQKKQRMLQHTLSRPEGRWHPT